MSQVLVSTASTMQKFDLMVNGTRRTVETYPDTPLLWVLREDLDLTGTKYGCGEGQCAYCTAGFIMTTTALLRTNPRPNATQVAQFLQGNICRCGTHQRIVAAVMRASELARGGA